MGNKKFMGVSQVDKTFRRLDMLITPEEEYAFALMYFTGSAKFNIGVRKIALEKGYSLNEHGLTPKKNIANPPILKSEEEIFNFLGIKMIEPRKRANENVLLNMMQ
jgi:DNA polymerase/3'-5' exonuclease PolX